MSYRDRTCGECRAFREIADGDQVATECRRHAPRASVLPVFTEDMDAITVWPDVGRDDPACEEFSPSNSSEAINA